jgi:hypothetical protein
MKILRNLSEDDMVAEFLKAEVASPRFSNKVSTSAVDNGLSPLQLLHPDTTNTSENAKRKLVLDDIRGYGSNTLLFAGLPKGLKWQLCEITLKDILACSYAYHSSWLSLSEGSLSVAVGAKNYQGFKADDIGKNVTELIPIINTGTVLPRVILLKDIDGSFIVFEGHTRITAYANALDSEETIEAIVGVGKNLSDWAWRK